MTRRGRRVLLGAIALAIMTLAPTAASAQEIRTATVKSKFDDVKFELTNAIINRGFVVDATGRLGDMLARTAKDVGSDVAIYSHAEYMTFCSAKLSRQMMEADVANIAFCPYVIFIYEAVAKPGEIVVGYRAPLARGDARSQAALAEIDAMLSAIIKDAVK
ncbi:MAG: DUF302 domain-containing protein [Hyphomicrobiaceae bacterium]